MSASGSEPTPAEGRLLWSVLKNMRNKPEVDWDTVASETNFKSGDVARTRYGQIRRKIEQATEKEDNAGTPSSTPSKGGGVSKAKGRVGSKAKTPTKGVGKKAQKAMVNASAIHDDEVDAIGDLDYFSFLDEVKKEE